MSGFSLFFFHPRPPLSNAKGYPQRDTKSHMPTPFLLGLKTESLGLFINLEGGMSHKVKNKTSAYSFIYSFIHYLIHKPLLRARHCAGLRMRK